MITKQDIKNTAFRLFARKGYAETSMYDISSILELKKQSLYSHFESKAEIFTEVLRDQTKIMIGDINAVLGELSDQPAEIFLKGIIESFMRIFTDRDKLLYWKRIILMIGNEEYCELVRGILTEFNDELRMSLYEAVRMKYHRLDHRNFDRFFLSYMLTIFGYLEWMVVDNADISFDDVWNSFWNGSKSLLGAENDDPV